MPIALSWLQKMPLPAVFLMVLMRCCHVCPTFMKSHRRREEVVKNLQEVSFCCARLRKKSYQGAELWNFSDAVQVKLKQDDVQDLTRLDEKMREQLMWYDIKLLRALVVFLETQLWTKLIHIASSATTNSDCKDANLSDNDDDKSLCEVKESMDHLVEVYR